MQEKLSEAKLPGLEIYDVLWILEQAPGKKLRLNSLAEKVYLSPYNVTRLVQRLEKENLITKSQCDQDKRGYYAKLTTKGEKLRKKIWKTYSLLIEEYYTSKLGQKEHKAIFDGLTKVYLKNHLNVE